MPNIEWQHLECEDQSEPAVAQYRARASSLQRSAERARFAEARDGLNRVARWYEVLAKYVERRRNPVTN